MLIFELQDNVIKLAQKLVGSVMTLTPERYIYFMDYWEYQRLTLQIRRLYNNPDAIVEDKLYKMIASSCAISEQRYLLYCLFDTPYCVLMSDCEQVMRIVHTTMQLAGRIMDAKRK